MPLERIPYQGPETFLEFYKKNAGLGDKLFRDQAKQMTEAVYLLDRIFKETIIYGVSSHLSIGLIPEKTGNQPKVRIHNIGLKDYFYVSYAIPKEIAPWDHAWVEGKQVSLEELEKYILLAMKRSEAWDDENSELSKLYAKNGID